MASMLVCAAGDIHGALDRLYADVTAFEASIGACFDWILHVGDFGVWPDRERVDSATRKHDGAGDFPTWWGERRPVPRRTVFIKGNHEDFVWLDAQTDPEILPGLLYLANGARLDVTAGARCLVVGGLGGCFGPSDFERSSKNLQGYAKRHYTRDEIDALATAGTVDVLLVHDAPAGVRFERHRRGPGYVSEAAGLDDLIRRVRPRVCLFGHHHARFDSEVDGVPCLGLNKVGKPGNLVAIEFDERGRGWSILGEWPPRRFE
jgi:predicted phosphodiesterase